MSRCNWCQKGYQAENLDGLCSLTCKREMNYYLDNAPCGNVECGISTAIDEETLTFGSGDLDDHGFFEHPCLICANEYKSKHPDAKVWPNK